MIETLPILLTGYLKLTKSFSSNRKKSPITTKRKQSEQIRLYVTKGILLWENTYELMISLWC